MALDLNEVSQFFLKVNDNVPLEKVIFTPDQKKMVDQFLRSAKNRAELRKYKIKATNTILLWGVPGTGKGTTLDTKIYTPNGYKLMKDIKVGDIIFDGKGEPTKVLGVYPQGIKKCYDIYFSDRTKITVDEDHLTQFYQTKVLHKKKVKGKVVSKEWGKKYQVLDTKELIQYFENEKKRSKIRPLRLDLPVLNYKYKKVDLDPYWLGLFLGDGCNRKFGIMFSNTEEDIKNYFLKYCKKINAIIKK